MVNTPKFYLSDFTSKLVSKSPKKELLSLALEAQQAKKYAQAMQYYEKMLQINATAEIYVQMASIAMLQGNVCQAITYGEIAVQLQPKSIDLQNYLGIIYHQSGRSEDAQQQFEHALILDEENPLTLYHLGSIQQNDWLVAKNLFFRSFAGIYKQFLQSPNSILNFSAVESMSLVCYANVCIEMFDWESYYQVELLLKSLINQQLYQGLQTSISPALAQILFLEPKVQYAISSNHAWARSGDPDTFYSYNLSSFPSVCAKLVIGYLLAEDNINFSSNVLVSYIKSHADNNIRTLLYSFAPQHSCDKLWPGLGVKSLEGYNYAGAAYIINQEKPHIFIETIGHREQKNLELLSIKVAPIQVSWLESFVYMGADYLQYMLIAKYLVTDVQKDSSTKFVLLPKLNQPLVPIELPKSNLREKYYLEAKIFVYASFLSPSLIDPEVFCCWMQILIKVNNSVLLLNDFSEYYQHEIYAKLPGYGISRDRILFVKEGDGWPFAEVDVLLDGFKVSCEQFARQSLAAATPIVTLSGEIQQLRQVANLLQCLNLPELIATTQQEYIDIAVKLASSQGKLGAKIQKMWQQGVQEYSPDNFAQYLNRAYREIWQSWRQQKQQIFINI